MSLRVWLPLNGDFHNQGLDGELNFATTGTITDINGKIGKGKEFSAASAIAPYDFTLGNEVSVACWIYYNAFPSSSSNDWIVHLGSASGYANAILGLSTYNSTALAIIIGGQIDHTYRHNFSLNTWYHIAFTWNNTQCKLYINGELKKTYTTLNNGTKLTSNKISLGANVINSVTRFAGRLNDVRIYDHCLSAKEVEEIAKGLVLHYKLDDTFIEPTTNLISAAASQETILNFTTSAYSTVPQNHTLSNAKYALSAFIDATNSTRALTGVQYRTHDGSAYSSWTIIPNTNVPMGQKKWINCIIDLTNTTLRTTDSNIQIRWFGSNTNSATTMIRSFYQLEEKDHCTPWVLGGTTRAASAVVYDSSGYINNGTIIGNLTATAGASRYELATNFATADNYISFPHLVDSDAMNNEFTFSCWLYRDYTDATQRALYYGLCSIYLHTNFKPRITWSHASADLSYNSVNTYAPSAIPIIPVQTWTHLAWTFKDGVLCGYVNGERKVRDDRSDTGTFIKGTRGTNGSVGYNWIGKISDVRTYATALSDEQIKELYDTSMSVDASGNIYAREVVE